MSPHHDPLDETGEAPPVSPGRRRASILAGMVLLLLILVALVWFVATNTERDENAGGWFSSYTSWPGQGTGDG